MQASPTPSASTAAFTGRGIFSLDFGYLGAGLRNNGWGLGCAYEHELTSFSAVKGSFAHLTLKPSGDRDWLTMVGLGLDARIYPFNRGMNRLYVGYGLGTDFLMLSNAESGNEVYISHCPQIGWKENFLNYVMVEAHIGYRMGITDVSDFALQSGIVKHGFEYGLSMKLNIRKIARWLLGRPEE